MTETREGLSSDLLQSQLEASILAGPLTINTRATVDQVALLLRRTAEELIAAGIVEKGGGAVRAVVPAPKLQADE
jgi:hypothetical protein